MLQIVVLIRNTNLIITAARIFVNYDIAYLKLIYKLSLLKKILNYGIIC